MAEKKQKPSVNCVKVDYVQITNDDFFTASRLAEWRIYIAKCCIDICDGLISKVDPVNCVTYFLSESLLKEVVGDAVIGMSKIIYQTPHPVEHPNAFKIAAYLGYWFLRHKPISILYPPNIDLDSIKVAPDYSTDPHYLSWQLKHINEAVAVNMVTSFIFDFDKQLCSDWKCKQNKRKNSFDGNPAFGFDDFNQQRQIMLQKMTYYFSYRAIAPKVIEHMLEGYAFHPAWHLTGPHWNTSISENYEQLDENDGE